MPLANHRDSWRRKLIPVTYDAGGSVAYYVSFAQGTRRWSASSGAPRINESLDRVKNMVLDWPEDPSRPAPRLLVSKDDIVAAWKRAETDSVLKQQLNRQGEASGIGRLIAKPASERRPAEVEAAVKPIRDMLSKLGNFDILRGAINLVTTYDAVIGTDLITAQDRALFRAQAAYLAYQLADAQTWSIERGYHSGNPNMSVSYVLSLGIIACALPDHPMARTWAGKAAAWMDHWLATEVSSEGQWLPEASHYTVVSLEPMLVFAFAAKRAGFADFTNDTRLMKFAEYYAKTLTPPDPQRGGVRTTGAWGRGLSGEKFATVGFAAMLFARTNPTLSRHLQWIWAQGGYSIVSGHALAAGLEPYLLDRELPQEKPEWASEFYPGLGMFLRAHFGTPQESYLLLLSDVDGQRNLDVWSPEIGGISQWYGRGAPLSTCFNMEGGYAERHELLRDGVRLARNWGDPQDSKKPFGYFVNRAPQEIAFLPRSDYAHTTYTYAGPDNRDWFPQAVPPAFPRVTSSTAAKLTWTRQLLFLRDREPAGPAYIVLRDTTAGGQPTQWQFRVLSEKIALSDDVKNLDAPLAEKPGQMALPSRELAHGNRYTAIGQYGVDVEFFIVNPSDTPRHTLRYGGKDLRHVAEYEDLLLLQQTGDGAYYLVLYPRLRAEPAPQFSTIADGKIVKIIHPFGIDYALLSSGPAVASGEGVTFNASAASVQQRATETVLSLASGGSAGFNDISITAPVAVSAEFGNRTISIVLANKSHGQVMNLKAPPGYKLQNGTGVGLQFQNGTYTVTFPAGSASASLVRD